MELDNKQEVFDHILKQIQITFGVNVIHGHITKDMQDDSDYLENICPTLHTGDSQILAYTRSTGTTLVTCDRGLTEAAISSGVQVINPDLLLCNKFENNIKSKISKIFQNFRDLFSETSKYFHGREKRARERKVAGRPARA